MKIEDLLQQYLRVSLPAKVYDAPKEAVTFDKMVVVFSTATCKTIKMVVFFNTEEGKIKGQF